MQDTVSENRDKWAQVMAVVNKDDSNCEDPNSRSTLLRDFEVVKSTSFFGKICLPFKSPLLVFLCMLYIGLQMGFIICATRNDPEPITLLAGGNWGYFYFVGVGFGILANLYTFAVAFFLDKYSSVKHSSFGPVSVTIFNLLHCISSCF